MLLVLKGRLKVLNTPYLVYSYNKLQAPRAATIQRRRLFESGVYSRAASDRADTVSLMCVLAIIIVANLVLLVIFTMRKVNINYTEKNNHR